MHNITENADGSVTVTYGFLPPDDENVWASQHSGLCTPMVGSEGVKNEQGFAMETGDVLQPFVVAI